MHILSNDKSKITEKELTITSKLKVIIYCSCNVRVVLFDDECGADDYCGY